MGSLYHRDESRGWPGVRGARGVARDGWVSLKEDWYFVSHPWTSDDRESQSSKKRNDKTRVRSREMEHLIFAPPLLANLFNAILRCAHVPQYQKPS